MTVKSRKNARSLLLIWVKPRLNGSGEAYGIHLFREHLTFGIYGDIVTPMEPSDIYCAKILTGELKVEVLTESDEILAFKHTQPFWETHIVVIPKKHIESLATANVDDHAILIQLILVASRLCADVQDQRGGCRLSTNVGSYQSSKHLHFYIHAGARLRNEDGSPVGGNH